jgi:hypothetical protein
MNLSITLDCPKCGKVIEPEIEEGASGPLVCPLCREETGFTLDGHVTPGLVIEKCVRCECEDFYWQSDFNRRIGFGLLLFAMGLSYWAFAAGWGFWAVLPMAIGALIDVALYSILPVVYVCYRCNAQYRNPKPNPIHKSHDLHTLEEYEHEARKKAKEEGKEFDPRIPQALYQDHEPTRKSQSRGVETPR